MMLAAASRLPRLRMTGSPFADAIEPSIRAPLAEIFRTWTGRDSAFEQRLAARNKWVRSWRRSASPFSCTGWDWAGCMTSLVAEKAEGCVHLGAGPDLCGRPSEPIAASHRQGRRE